MIYRTQQLTDVWANSGSVDDIQNAILDAIQTHADRVLIPEGTFEFAANGTYRVEFTMPSWDLTIVGAGIDKTVLAMPIDDSANNTSMFKIHGLNGGKLRIFGITFKGRPNWQSSPTGDSGINIESCKDFRVDHCSFYWMGAIGVAVADVETQYGYDGGNPQRLSQGVVDHCDFIDIHKPAALAAGRGYGYGVAVARAYHWKWTYYPDDPWGMFGKYENNVYVEDCYFTGCRHATQGNWGGAYVLRHCIIEDVPIHAAVCTGHPVRELVYGMFSFEIYDNIFRNTGKHGVSFIGPNVEGGSGLIYRNRIENLGASVLVVGHAEHMNPEFFPKGNLKELYFWDNDIIGDKSIYINENAGGIPVEGTDFFTDLTGMYTTEQIQAMIDREVYMPYQYPHPLTLEGGPPTETTPWTGVLEDGIYRITMPQTVEDEGKTYWFARWEDGSTDPARIINFTADITIEAIYELAPPIPSIGLPEIGVSGLVIADTLLLGFYLARIFGVV